MGNQETDLCSHLLVIESLEIDRSVEPRKKDQQPKTTGESDNLTILREGKADHMEKGLSGNRYFYCDDFDNIERTISTIHSHPDIQKLIAFVFIN